MDGSPLGEGVYEAGKLFEVLRSAGQNLNYMVVFSDGAWQVQIYLTDNQLTSPIVENTPNPFNLPLTVWFILRQSVCAYFVEVARRQHGGGSEGSTGHLQVHS